MIAPPHETFSGEWTNNAPWPWFLPCWHHWPTAQLIDSDGSVTFVENGRPKSSCLTRGWGYGDVKNKKDAVQITANSLTRFALTGMTDGSAASLAPLARSWRQPPVVATTSDGFRSDGFLLGEKAFQFSRTATKSLNELQIQIAVSESSPLVNPAFVIRNWGTAAAKVGINGKNFTGEDCLRVGRRQTPTGFDLVVWLKYSATKPVTIVFSRLPE